MPGQKSVIEKRKSPRIPINLPMQLIINNTPNPLRGSTVNLSEGGVCFEVEEPLPITSNDSILSKIDIYPYQIETFIELIWNRPPQKQQKFCYGGRFEDVTEKNRNYLKSAIELNEQSISEKLDPIMEMIDKRAEYMKQKVADFFKRDNLICIKEFIDLRLGGLDTDSQKKIDKKLDYLVSQGSKVENIVNYKPIIKMIKQQFRGILGTWLYQSKIMRHALDKPRGYPGDYKLLEIIYNNKEISDKNAKCFDRYFLNNPYAVAVRNRKDLMRKVLKEFILQRKEDKKLEFLNLASGSCREIRDLIGEQIDYKGILDFTCVDFDDEALSFSAELFKNTPDNINIHMAKENIIDIGNKPDKYAKVFTNKDLIYSIGLADYLPDKVLRKLLQFCYSILNADGKIVIAFKDREKNKHGPLPPDWYCNWTFIPRTKAKVMEFIEECGFNKEAPKVIWEESGVIFFLMISKI